MSRWIGFLIAILVGIGAGLLYGWVNNPVEYVNTTPDTLRVDYKSDFVLMVAESFRLDNDLGLAARRLALLGSTHPAKLAEQAILFAQRAGYSDTDLAAMQALANALQGYSPDPETPAP